MNTFKEYLTESKKTYKFMVKIAGELPEGCADMLESCMTKYKIINMSNGKRTPISERPLDFPNLQNQEVMIWEVEVEYPTTSHVLETYIANCCNVPKGHIRVRSEHDPIEELQNKEEPQTYETLLTKEDMGGEGAQDSVAGERVMGLLKELETARKERGEDPTNGTPVGQSQDIKDETVGAKSPIGS